VDDFKGGVRITLGYLAGINSDKGNPDQQE